MRSYILQCVLCKASQPVDNNIAKNVVSNTIKENPEVLEEYSSLVFGVKPKCYGFLESLEPQDVRGGLRFPVFRFIPGL